MLSSGAIGSISLSLCALSKLKGRDVASGNFVYSFSRPRKRKVKRISVSFDAEAALSQVFANNEYFANYDELISLLYNYFKQFSSKNNKIQQTGKKQATK